MPRHLPDTPAPPQVWVIDNYRVHRWYYREAPHIGDWVYYMDGTRARIATVSSTRVLLTNSCSMRRPYALARLVTWAQPRLRHGLTRLSHMKAARKPLSADIVYV